MSNSATYPSNQDSAENSLPAPELTIPGVEVLDDEVIDGSPNGLPFRIKRYADMTAGDNIFFYLNGHLVRSATLTAEDVGKDHTIYVSPQPFNFTGKCWLYYMVQKTETGNTSPSTYAIYPVIRSLYPALYAGGTPSLPAPVIAPDLYKESDYLASRKIQITISYSDMRQQDQVTVRFELRATTSDKSGVIAPYFYEVAELQHSVTLEDIERGETILFDPLPAGTFKGVDENIGQIYYTIDRPDSSGTLLQPSVAHLRSPPTVFTVDVVSPHG